MALKGAAHAVWLVCNNLEIGARKVVGLRSALLPIAQRADRYVMASRKFLLRQAERPAQYPRSRCPLHSGETLLGERLRIRIGECRSVGFLVGQRVKATPMLNVLHGPASVMGYP